MGYRPVVRRFSCTLLVLPAVLALFGCKKPNEEEGELCEADLEQIRTEILTPNCTNEACHDADAPAANLDFTRDADGISAQLLEVPSGVCADWVRVVPGDPESSMLFAKLHAPPPCGEQMPIDGHLSERDIACIEHWIEEVENTCETCGGDLCVDLQSDAENCGECGNACPAGVACVAGECSCDAGTEQCGDMCVNTGSDPDNCGGCDQPCDPSEVCNAGTCVAGCDMGLEQCGGACVDTMTNAEHCGMCDNPCNEGQTCIDGACACADEIISLASTVGPLFVNNCALGGCHAPPHVQLGLDLRDGNAHASLVGVASSQCGTKPRVDPGNPGNSYLLDKLHGVDLCDGFQMPLNTEPLSPADIELISDWICQGAQNN
jgi:hypothetical protein